MLDLISELVIYVCLAKAGGIEVFSAARALPDTLVAVRTEWLHDLSVSRITFT